MQYIGIDIVEIDRVEDAVSRWGQRFLSRVYTPREIVQYRLIHSLAARFAGKEAVMKALASPGFGVSWREIEILSGNNGQPVVNLYGRARQMADELGLSGLSISLSHCREYAVAAVTGESRR